MPGGFCHARNSQLQANAKLSQGLEFAALERFPLGDDLPRVAYLL